MVKFLPVTDWEVLTLDWVYELWKMLKEQRENGVEDSIKTWSLNNKMIVNEDQEYARILEAWHKKNLWYGVDYEMTEAALSYHNTILNSYLIGFDEKCPEYLEMIDAYMKGTFLTFFTPKNLPIGLKTKIQKNLIMRKMLYTLSDKVNMEL